MGQFIIVITCVSIFLASIIGYIMNIYKLATIAIPLAEWTITEIIRIVGVLVPFIGAIMGYI